MGLPENINIEQKLAQNKVNNWSKAAVASRCICLNRMRTKQKFNFIEEFHVSLKPNILQFKLTIMYLKQGSQTHEDLQSNPRAASYILKR